MSCVTFLFRFRVVGHVGDWPGSTDFICCAGRGRRKSEKKLASRAPTCSGVYHSSWQGVEKTYNSTSSRFTRSWRQPLCGSDVISPRGGTAPPHWAPFVSSIVTFPLTMADPVADKSGFLCMYMSSHPDTLVAYAKYFGKVDAHILSAKMLSINSQVKLLSSHTRFPSVAWQKC